MNKLKLLFLLLLFSQCEEAKIKTVPPQLGLIVLDANDYVVDKATVYVFKTADNWKSATNSYKGPLYTNSNGELIIQNLEASIYYIYVEKDKLNNKNGVFTYSEPLKENQIANLKIKIK